MKSPPLSRISVDLRGEPHAVALAKAGDERVLGGEVAIEVAGAHARFRRHVHHRGAMEAGADEAPLGGVEDVRAALGGDFLGRDTRSGCVHRSSRCRGENESSFTRMNVYSQP